MTGQENVAGPPSPGEQSSTPARARIMVGGDVRSLSAARRAEFVDALAAVLRTEPQLMHQHAVYGGDLSDAPWAPGQRALVKQLIPRALLRAVRREEAGIVFDLGLSAESAERLRFLVGDNSNQLHDLRLRKVAIELEAGITEEWVLSSGRFILVSSTPTVPARPEATRLHFLAPVLVGAMTGCIAWSFVVFIHLFYPNWSRAYLVLACTLAAVEAGYSHQLLRGRRRFLEDIVRFRAIELALLFILIKAGSYLGRSWSAMVSEIRLWPHDPLAVLEVDAIVVYALALIAWYSANATAGDLDRLGEPPVRVRSYTSPVESLTNRFFWGAGLLLAVSGMALVGETIAASPARSIKSLLQGVSGSPASGLAVATLIYFCLGLLMLGQARITLYQMGWEQQGIPIDRALVGRWTRGGLVLVVLAASLSIVLPADYQAAAWLLETVGTALAWLAAIVTYLAGLVMFALISLLGLLAYLLALGGTLRPKPTAPVEFVRPVTPQAALGATPDWVLILRSILFWGLLLASLVYVLRAYLRDHPHLMSWARGLRLVGVLRRLWQRVQDWLARRPRIDLQRYRLRARLPGAIKISDDPFRLFRLGRLSPRDRVLYYYWSVLRRAHRVGLARRMSQTPYEYCDSLGPHICQTEHDLARLTDAFVQARYSSRPLASDEDGRARVYWQRVRSALQSIRRKGRSSGEPGSDVS